MSSKWNPDIRTGNQWYILVVIGMVFMGCIAVIHPICQSAKEPNPKYICLSNVKQLALSFAIYGTDYDDRLPSVKWYEAVEPYNKRKEYLKCPEVGRDGYAMNLALAGKKIPDRPTVLLFETDTLERSVMMNPSARKRDRHNGGSHVSYTDTSAKWIAKDEEP